MHRTETKNYFFLHNSDFSGDVIVVEKKSEKQRLEIPFDDLKLLVAEYIKGKRIDELEQAEPDEILEGLK